MITLSDKIQNDVQLKEVTLIPLIVIDSDSENPIYISTIKHSFKINNSTDSFAYWEDRGLKINSIKESLNITSKKFKINNLTFELSNYPVNNTRFSDFVSDRGLLNKTVEVYYKTQSCESLEDCMLIYKGNIRSLDHDSKNIRINLEDLTEDKLSKKIPLADTGFGEDL